MKRCYLCGYEINGNIKDPRNPAFKTMDHVKPRAMGGKQAGNLRPTHRICNNTKRDRFPVTAEIVNECRVAFRKTKAYKKIARQLSRVIETRSDHFCLGEHR